MLQSRKKTIIFHFPLNSVSNIVSLFYHVRIPLFYRINIGRKEHTIANIQYDYPHFGTEIYKDMKNKQPI